MSSSNRATLATALLLAGAWTAVQARLFDGNPWPVDGALVAGYFVLDLCAWGVALRLARAAGVCDGAGAVFGTLFSLEIASAAAFRSDLNAAVLLSLPVAVALAFVWPRVFRRAAWRRPDRADVLGGAIVALAWVFRPGGFGWSATAGGLALAAGYLGMLSTVATLVLWLARSLAGAHSGASAAWSRCGAAVALLLALGTARLLPPPLRAHVLQALPLAVVTAATLGILVASRPAGRWLDPGVSVAARRPGLVAAGVVLAGLGSFALSRSLLDRTTVSFDAARHASATRVVLLAVDGADPEVLERLMAQGSLPGFARLRAQGAYARLTTISPLSPVVWTTIATGAAPEQHGVRDFLTTFVRGTTAALPRFFQDPLMTLGGDLVGEDRPVSSGTRRTRALWEILTLAGRRSLIVNWWATYPAEPIDGVMVSNFAFPWSGFGDADYDALAPLPRLVFPQQVLPKVLATARAFTHEAGFARLTNPGKVRRDQTFPRATQDFFVARDAAVERVFDSLLEPRDALESSYYQQIDTASHTFTEAAFGSPLGPVRPLRISEAASQALWAELVAPAYGRIDAVVGRALDRLQPDQVLVLVSDHGWRYDGSAHGLLPPGVLFLYGPRFRPGHVIEKASVYDVFPTLAAALGVPLSRRLPGKVLTEAFVTGAEPAVEYIETYGSRDDRIELRSTGDDGAHIERLRALGYVK